jgi:FKBP-type peptidyl-prolyl cis-trans isomerase FklB
MRYALIIPSIFALAITSTAHAAPTSELDKLSYSFGAKTGETFKEQQIQINASQFASGFNDALAGKKLALTEQQMKDVLMKFQTEHIAKLSEQDKKLAVANAAKSEKFLQENKNKPNVKTTSSGLQYVVITEGKGAAPKKTDLVTVNYRGTLLDGTEFDSSYSRNEPLTLPLNELIPAWQEALTMMTPGSTWKIYAPPKLAYGDKGAGRSIPPNATLVFEIELIKVKPGTSKQ